MLGLDRRVDFERIPLDSSISLPVMREMYCEIDALWQVNRSINVYLYQWCAV